MLFVSFSKPGVSEAPHSAEHAAAVDAVTDSKSPAGIQRIRNAGEQSHVFSQRARFLCGPSGRESLLLAFRRGDENLASGKRWVLDLADRQADHLRKSLGHIIPRDSGEKYKVAGEGIGRYLRGSPVEDLHVGILGPDVTMQFHQRIKVGVSEQLGYAALDALVQLH